MMTNEEIAEIAGQYAKDASQHAYAPYSKFRVGACVVIDGPDCEPYFYTGCNVENASYGLTNCAERTAIFGAVVCGGLDTKVEGCDLVLVAIYTPTDKPAAPCGACRQVINEFGPHARVISFCDGEDVIDTTLDQLLPGAFGPGNLL